MFVFTILLLIFCQTLSVRGIKNLSEPNGVDLGFNYADDSDPSVSYQLTKVHVYHHPINYPFSSPQLVYPSFHSGKEIKKKNYLMRSELRLILFITF